MEDVLTENKQNIKIISFLTNIFLLTQSYMLYVGIFAKKERVRFTEPFATYFVAQNPDIFKVCEILVWYFLWPAELELVFPTSH